MSIEVIGAGLGRTGTMSLKKALEILGYDPTYHMIENIKRHDSAFWVKVYDGIEPYDFDEVFNRPNVKYSATCDWPAAPFWEELLVRYPQAKVILTIRDPEAWYESCCETILCMSPYSPFCLFGTKVLMYLGWPHPDFAELQDCFFRFSPKNTFSKEQLIEQFNTHNANVIAKCPPEKLLVYDISAGWGPLCRFLNKPIPDVPFPHANERKEFKRIVQWSNRMGYAIFIAAIALPVLFLVALYYYYFNSTADHAFNNSLNKLLFFYSFLFHF